MLALRRKPAVLEHADHAVGRARPHQWIAQHEAPDVVRMETVHVLARRDRLDDRALVDVVRQWHLHQDPVDRDIEIQSLDQAQQFGLCRRMGQVVAYRDEPAFLAGSPLVPHVDVRGWIVADEDHRKARPPLALRGEAVAPLADFAPKLGSDRLAVDDPA